MLRFLASRIGPVTPERALPGREKPIRPTSPHAVLGTSLVGPWPAGMETAVVALGCFWGAEKEFWTLPGVHSTAVGYAGGHTPNPTYREVCSGRTGHTESVLVVHDPAVISYEALLARFWEGHDPTQGMRQGRDLGTQYRSAIVAATGAQREIAEASMRAYGERLAQAGYNAITTEILDASPFYYAEPGHQQYLITHPNGYCPEHGTGVSCPVGLRSS